MMAQTIKNIKDITREKGRDLTQSYDKTPTCTEKSRKRDNIKMQPKTSIAQRFRTDLGRSVEVTIATQLQARHPD